MKLEHKVMKIIEHELDNIIKYQDEDNETQKDSLFENFDENFQESLKKHEQFMQRIFKAMNI